MAMIWLRGGYATLDRRLDRLPSSTEEHLMKYPLTASTMPEKPTSMVAGINWYSNFDDPVKEKIQGRWRWVIGRGQLGPIRGGHAICLRGWTIRDAFGWYLWYDQLAEGRCVEFATMRMLSHINRVRYDVTSRWPYWWMQQNDEWEGGSYPNASPQYEGTSVRAGLVFAQTLGAIRARLRGRPVSPEEAPSLVSSEHAIGTYRWATDWNDVRRVLGVPDWLPGVPFNNSWGDGYPRETILLDEAGEQTLREEGEFGVVTDR